MLFVSERVKQKNLHGTALHCHQHHVGQRLESNYPFSMCQRFNLAYDAFLALIGLVGTDLKEPRQVERQLYRVNIDCDSDQEYFKRSVYKPFLDHVISELRERFSVHQQRIVNLWVLIPKCITSYSFTNF